MGLYTNKYLNAGKMNYIQLLCNICVLICFVPFAFVYILGKLDYSRGRDGGGVGVHSWPNLEKCRASLSLRNPPP